MKRGLAAILLAVLLLHGMSGTACGVQTLSVTDTAQSCGAQMVWTLEDGTLRISGDGRMDEYSDRQAPWNAAEVECVEMSEGIQSIGDFAFADCTHLTQIEIPESVTSIGGGAFDGCRSLETMTLPSKVCTIASALFMDCAHLKEVHWNGTVSVIGASAFFNCSSLESIDLAGVRIIGDSAFYRCDSLREIKIPSSVRRIDGMAFGTLEHEDSRCQTIRFEGAPPEVAADAFVHRSAVMEYPEELWKEIPAWGDGLNWRAAHRMQYVPPKAAECEQEGSQGYWLCQNLCCEGIYYADADGMRRLTSAQAVLQARPHEWEMKPYDPCTDTEILYECKLCHRTKTEKRTAAHIPSAVAEEVIRTPDRLDGVGACEEVICCSVCGKELSRTQKELRYRILLSEDTCIYNGRVQEPKVTVQLGNRTISEDLYTVSYRNSVNAGTAAVLVTAKSGTMLKGTAQCSYEIQPCPITEKTASLSKNQFTYSGNARKPTVRIEGLKENRDFRVSYRKNRNIGTASAVVCGIGNYCGTLEPLTFEIVPKGTRLTGVTCAQSKLKVVWCRQTIRTDGYQIAYAYRSDFADETVLTISDRRKQSLRKKLNKTKKRCYVRIRTYKQIGGRDYCSAWSAARRVKIK